MFRWIEDWRHAREVNRVYYDVRALLGADLADRLYQAAFANGETMQEEIKWRLFRSLEPTVAASVAAGVPDQPKKKRKAKRAPPSFATASAGGKASAAALTPAQRSARSRKGALVRWGKVKPKKAVRKR